MDFRIPARFLSWLPLLCLTALGACSDQDQDQSRPDPQVIVGLVPGGTVVSGVKVVAMDPLTNLPASRPRVSGGDGLCTFDDLPAGHYRLVAFGGPGLSVVNCDELVVAGDKAGGEALLAPGGAGTSSPAPLPAAILMRQLGAPGGLPRFGGQVVDDDTGEPIAGAFVSTSPFLGGYSGGTTFKDDVTLADGRFLVSEIAVAADPVSGNLVHIEPLLVNCAGYRPRRYLHDFPNGDENLDVSGVTIRLKKVQPQDTGSLGGRLLLLGEPAAGVVVGLGAAAGSDAAEDKSAVGLPGFTTLTDQDGAYRFTGLPAGVYFVHPGFLPHDGWVYVGQAGTLGLTVATDRVTESPDLQVLHEIDPIHPAGGEVFPDTPTLGGFMWSEVPGAVSYTIYLDRGLVGTSEVAHIELPAEMVLPAGEHVWSVLALVDAEQVIGAMQVQGRFYLVE